MDTSTYYECRLVDIWLLFFPLSESRDYRAISPIATYTLGTPHHPHHQ